MLATLGSHVDFYSFIVIKWLNVGEWFRFCVFNIWVVGDVIALILY